MSELVTWLRGQIAEKRRRAMRTAFSPDGPAAAWSYDRTKFQVTTLDSAGAQQGVASRRAGVGTDGDPYEDVLLDVDGEHMELNDPQTAIAECDAHEAVVVAYESAEVRRARLVEEFTRDLKKIADLDPGEQRRRYSEVSKAEGLASGYGMAVRMAASAYRHRPGYREEWRP